MDRKELMNSKVYKQFEEEVEKFGGLDKVLAWSRERFPQFQNNLRILFEMWLRLYLNVRSIVIKRDRKRLADLRIGDKATIELVIGLKQRSFGYMACPKCFKRVKGNHCAIHGIVEPIRASFDYYTGADETGEILVLFPPRVSNRDYSGTKIRAFGVLREDRNNIVFHVYKIYNVEEVDGQDEYNEVARILRQQKKMTLKAFRAILEMRGLQEETFYEKFGENILVDDVFIRWRD